MSENAIDILERRLVIHVERRTQLYTTLREVETDIDNIHKSLHRHIHALRDPHVIDQEK